ncbi:hypothetical protein DC915_RS01585 [Vibrio parahaemolyticus]|nr:hypothetical protein [Vibrio parahaemolyticus]EJG0009664.1 hypothetical protein [Vibrio parahaemolyticus]
MKQLLLAALIVSSTSAWGDADIVISREMFCSMHESLLSTTGLIDAAEMAGLVQHLPGFNFAKSDIERTINHSSKLWQEECLGIESGFEVEVKDTYMQNQIDEFNPTKEQADKLAELASEWVLLLGSSMDTSDIKKQIESLQAEIRANKAH